MTSMTEQIRPPRLVSDQLWDLLAPLIPPPPPAKNGRSGRPRIEDRDVLEGILFVVHHGIAWKNLPAELGYGSGVTCWRRLRSWQEAGVWETLHHSVLHELSQEHLLHRVQDRPGPGKPADDRGC